MPRVRDPRPKKLKPFMPRPQLPPVSIIKVWSSSHGKEDYGLPPALKVYLERQQRSHLPPSSLTFEAKGGGKICPSVVSKVKRALRLSSGKAQCHVLILGTNNGRGENPEEPAVIAAYFKEILEEAEGIPKSHVVVCGLLPSPEGAERNGPTTERFRETSSLLKDLTTGYSRSSFLDIPDFFTENGVVKEHLYRRKRGQADIHFSRDGAALYAKALGQHISFLRRETWL